MKQRTPREKEDSRRQPVTTYRSSAEIPAVRAARPVQGPKTQAESSNLLSEQIAKEQQYREMVDEYNALQEEYAPSWKKAAGAVGSSLLTGNIPVAIGGLGGYGAGHIQGSFKAKKEVIKRLMDKGVSEKEANAMVDRMYADMHTPPGSGGPGNDKGDNRVMNLQANIPGAMQGGGAGTALSGVNPYVPGPAGPGGPGTGLSIQPGKFTPLQPYRFGGY